MIEVSAAQRELNREQAGDGRLESVVQDIVASVAQAIRPRPLAIILTGSFARGEGSVLTARSALRVLGDMEFMVVFDGGADLAGAQRALATEAKAITDRLATQHVECDVELSAVSRNYFQSLRPQIFGYELLSWGRTVWGDAEILASAPRFAAESIPHWDAWRMLNNRMLEQLLWVEVLESGGRESLIRMFYNIVKLQLDIGTSVLIFAGRYEDSYVGRATALLRWQSEAECSGDTAFVRELAGLVAEATQFKLCPDLRNAPHDVRLDADAEVLRKEIRKVVTGLVPIVHSIWRWEIGKITHQPIKTRAGDSELSEAILAWQTWREKLRGWAKLVSIREVRQQRGFYPRMLRMLRRGSPRYLVYLAGAELYFRLPVVLKGEQPDEDIAALAALLPVRFAESTDKSCTWRGLRADVLACWRLFLRNHWA